MALKHVIIAAAVIAASLGNPGPALAINILLTNDDGFETANLRALYQTLVEAGHSVIVSAPVQNQSGQGGRIDFNQPIGPLAAPSRFGTVPAGSPGVGRDPAVANIHYVAGSPVTSLLYGLDVLAPRIWGRPPDLVIAGPNEGNNAGPVIVSSGTVSAALYGINRGIPSIAISDGGHDGRSYATLTAGDPAYRTAAIARTLIDRLSARAARKKIALMPRGIGLNVNVPAIGPSCRPRDFALSEIGRASSAAPVFVENPAASAAPAAVPGDAGLPRLTIIQSGMAPPNGINLPTDDNPRAEANGLARCLITVSPISGTPDARRYIFPGLKALLAPMPPADQ